MYGKINLKDTPLNWDVEGLPSVGDKVDVFSGSYEHIINTICVDYVGKTLVMGTDLNNEEFCFTTLCYVFKPTPNPNPNPKEAGRQKAIDEMLSIHRENIDEWLPDYKNCVKQYTIDLYDNGYTKSKVKPLSLTDFKLIYVKSINFEDFHASLIRDGYCRGSAD
jgi:hypothetical protein